MNTNDERPCDRSAGARRVADRDDVDLEAGVLRVVGKGGQGAGAVHVKDGRRVDVSTRGRTEEEARAFLARVAEQPPEGPCVFVNANARNSHRLHRGGQALATRSLSYVVQSKVSAIVGPSRPTCCATRSRHGCARTGHRWS
jgi:hypothetical protein